MRYRPPLIEALQQYDQHRRRRFHVPAHAGFCLFPADWDLMREPYRYDLTELEGLDVLSGPSECIQEAQSQVAQLFQASQSFFLVNGASVGIMAALLATVKPGEKVLLPRNVHRSVLSALILLGAEPVWFLPTWLPEWGLWGGVTPQQVLTAFEKHPNSTALVLTSPTYEGLGSDIPAIAQLCRTHHIRLIVDEAHGSLWPFCKTLPPSAVAAFGCDAVIHSVHKSGGSLTQSALLHLPMDSLLDPAAIQQALNTLQTTSPSYLLMASLEASVHFLASEEGQARITSLITDIQEIRTKLRSQLKHLHLFQPEEKPPFQAWDPTKLYLTHSHQPGEAWANRLEHESQLAYESASPDGALYLANLGLSPQDLQDFTSILLKEDARHPVIPAEAAGRPSKPLATALQNPMNLLPESVLLPRDAFFALGEKVSAHQAIGRIAKETIVHCPPGIPILMPGERITETHRPFLPENGVIVVTEPCSIR